MVSDPSPSSDTPAFHHFRIHCRLHDFVFQSRDPDHRHVQTFSLSGDKVRLCTNPLVSLAGHPVSGCRLAATAAPGMRPWERVRAGPLCGPPRLVPILSTSPRLLPARRRSFSRWKLSRSSCSVTGCRSAVNRNPRSLWAAARTPWSPWVTATRP